MKAKSYFKWLGMIVVVLITLGFLVLAFENYRGRHAWDQYRAEAEERGERLDLKAFLPAEVADDQNFAATPLLAPLFDARWDAATGDLIYADSNRVEQVKSLFGWHRHLTRREAGWRAGEPIDLQARQEALRGATNSADPELRALQARETGDPAAELLFLLDQRRAELEEIRAAARRPYSQIPMRSHDDQMATRMSYFSVIKSFIRAFQTKALAELAQGNTAAAAEDVNTIIALAGTLKHEPLLISGLVRLAAVSTIFQPLWEGLARRQWSDEELAGFEVALSQVNLVEEMAFWLRGERAFSLSHFAVPRKGQVNGADGADPGPGQMLSRMPAGWRYQNQVEIARMYDQYVLPVLHPEVPMVDLTRSFELEQEADKRRTRHPYRMMAMMLAPAVQKAALKSAQSQADAHLARVACALERYYLAEGKYPERLEALSPRLLTAVPVDPVNGLPLHYQQIEDGRFVLYSVGSDLDDDGGRIPSAKGRARGGEPDGDWVWRYDHR